MITLKISYETMKTVKKLEGRGSFVLTVLRVDQDIARI